jgi:trans-aconitate 2-methyltransferase
MSSSTPAWRPDQYLQFEQERTRPCHDLVSRISTPNARTVIDLGCGPGNSTAVLAERWPDAKITGLDSSTAMLDRARRSHPAHEWIAGDIPEWAMNTDAEFDVVFSNAALQWVPNHEAVYPRLLARVASGGVLAIQVPADINAPAHQIKRELASSVAWRDRFTSAAVREWFVHEASFYYDALAGAAKTLDLWETEYIHIMPDAESIGEWYKATGLRPFLNALPGEDERNQFVKDYVDTLRGAYLPRGDGRILFPFRRLFLIAGK